MAANSGSGQGLWRTAAGGGNFVGCEESASHLVKPQQHKLFCARREGQTLPYIMQ